MGVPKMVVNMLEVGTLSFQYFFYILIRYISISIFFYIIILTFRNNCDK